MTMVPQMFVFVACICHVALHTATAAYREGQPVPVPYDNRPPVSRYGEPRPPEDYGGHLPDNQGRSALNRAAKIKSGQGQNCYKIPKYTYYNISDNSYYYPKNNVNQELTERKDILEKIFKDGVKALGPYDEKEALYNPTIQDKQSSVGDGVRKSGDYDGCAAYKLLLRSFDFHGGHCWLVHPRHQAVSFVSCGAPKCMGHQSYGEYSVCAVEEMSVGVWAWCENLPYGKRISKVYIPVPVSCKCQVYDC